MSSYILHDTQEGCQNGLEDKGNTDSVADKIVYSKTFIFSGFKVTFRENILGSFTKWTPRLNPLYGMYILISSTVVVSTIMQAYL